MNIQRFRSYRSSFRSLWKTLQQHAQSAMQLLPFSLERTGPFCPPLASSWPQNFSSVSGCWRAFYFLFFANPMTRSEVFEALPSRKKSAINWIDYVIKLILRDGIKRRQPTGAWQRIQLGVCACVCVRNGSPTLNLLLYLSGPDELSASSSQEKTM